MTRFRRLLDTHIQNKKRSTGCMAQEVMEIPPGAVFEEGHKKCAYGNLAVLFVESFKELKGEPDVWGNPFKGKSVFVQCENGQAGGGSSKRDMTSQNMD